MHRTPPGLASSSVECCSEFEEDDDDEAEQQVPYVFSRLFEESREKGCETQGLLILFAGLVGGCVETF